jgi:protein MpaA
MIGHSRRVLLLVLACICGCAARKPAMVEPSPHAPDTEFPMANDTVRSGTRQVVFGASSRGATIAADIFGQDAGETVLIFAAIHGDEGSTAVVAKKLIAYLDKHPEAAMGKRVAIIAVANPDGLKLGTRTNANKVDVNRNFPASNWKTSLRKTQYYNGPSAASEPETRALIAAVDRLRPRRIIAMHSIGENRHCNNYDGPGKNLAEMMSRFNQYPVTATMGYPTPGSFGTWAGIDQQSAVITLELPRSMSGEKAWEGNREALLAFIRG